MNPDFIKNVFVRIEGDKKFVTLTIDALISRDLLGLKLSPCGKLFKTLEMEAEGRIFNSDEDLTTIKIRLGTIWSKQLSERIEREFIERFSKKEDGKEATISEDAKKYIVRISDLSVANFREEFPELTKYQQAYVLWGYLYFTRSPNLLNMFKDELDMSKDKVVENIIPEKISKIMDRYPTMDLGFILVRTCLEAMGITDDNPEIEEEIKNNLPDKSSDALNGFNNVLPALVTSKCKKCSSVREAWKLAGYFFGHDHKSLQIFYNFINNLMYIEIVIYQLFVNWVVRTFHSDGDNLVKFYLDGTWFKSWAKSNEDEELDEDQESLAKYQNKQNVQSVSIKIHQATHNKSSFIMFARPDSGNVHDFTDSYPVYNMTNELIQNASQDNELELESSACGDKGIMSISFKFEVSENEGEYVGAVNTNVLKYRLGMLTGWNFFFNLFPYILSDISEKFLECLQQEDEAEIESEVESDLDDINVHGNTDKKSKESRINSMIDQMIISIKDRLRSQEAFDELISEFCKNNNQLKLINLNKIVGILIKWLFNGILMSFRYWISFSKSITI